MRADEINDEVARFFAVAHEEITAAVATIDDSEHALQVAGDTLNAVLHHMVTAGQLYKARAVKRHPLEGVVIVDIVYTTKRGQDPLLREMRFPIARRS